MPINSRNKGAQFEREVAKILNTFFTDNNIDFQTKRNLDQYQTKNECDLTIPFHAVECKFYKEGCGYKSPWWQQVCESAGDNIPALVYKYNRKPIEVCIPLHAINTDWPANNDAVAIIPINDWLQILKNNWHKYAKIYSSVCA
tara:strand:+ start:388 stop:816 length:429 start_codon:yes stop_codon:yes gene_type:complete